MFQATTYKPKQFNLNGLKGISDKTLETHFKLYEGYVKAVNELNEKIADVLRDGMVDKEEFPAYSELTRRLGFEYNGKVLHEYYFENLKRDGTGSPGATFKKAAETSFGSFETWKTDFAGVGKMRGVGWAMCYQDPGNGSISNHWITLHEVGNVSGFIPILVMDVWEHAFIFDYAPADRPKYIEAFFSNVDWDAVQSRFSKKVVAPAA
jgi:Fe-Mn family superoxide dismutase